MFGRARGLKMLYRLFEQSSVDESGRRFYDGAPKGTILELFSPNFVAALPPIELPHGLNLSNVRELPGT
jgi:hypothetical protein